MKFLYREDILRKTIERTGEVKLGESVACLEPGENLDDLEKYARGGVRFALLGIPESIGIRANHGRAGAERSWHCFLNSFLNMQCNRFMTGGDILCLGNVYTDELEAISDRMEIENADYIVKLRKLCDQLDHRVYPIIAKVVKAGLIPIIIGGGQNNAYPILKGICQVPKYKKGIGCLNCDPHADFRPLEGRHNGNCFSYAYEKGFLKKYFALGLHESYNGEEMLRKMESLPNIGCSFFNVNEHFNTLIDNALHFFEDKATAIGLELDLDSIADMPASACTPSGISINQARRYISQSTRALNPIYFHLSEGAPSSQLFEQAHVGKAIAYFVSDFVKASNAIIAGKATA